MKKHFKPKHVVPLGDEEAMAENEEQNKIEHRNCEFTNEDTFRLSSLFFSFSITYTLSCPCSAQS